MLGLSCITEDLWYGAQAPECMGPIIVVHRLNCPMTCGILVPRLKLEHAFPALEGGFLTTGPPGNYLHYGFNLHFPND